jgi:imidazolonepropionase-like amidohydrolase
MKLRLSLVPILLLAAASHVAAAAAADPWVIVHAGQLLDRPGQAPRGAATIVLQGERISELRDGHHGLAELGLEEAEIIDLREYFVLPGLIDCHVHLSSDLGGVARRLAAVSQSQADVAYEAALNARKTLAAGFTTVRNLGDRDGIIRALRDAIALRLGADSIEHGTLLDDVGLRLFRESGAYYVPTLSTVNGYIERLEANPDAYTGEVLEKIRWRIDITGQSLERAVPAGVKIAFGTDAGVSLHGRNADEFELMVQHGMTAEQAIIAATVNAADLLGMSAELGTLEAGKYADLIAVRGNPLDDISVLKNIERVVKGGMLVR